MIKVQNRKTFYVVKICFFLMYIKSARFQLENWDAQARLDSQSSQLGLAQIGKFQLELIASLCLSFWYNFLIQSFDKSLWRLLEMVKNGHQNILLFLDFTKLVHNLKKIVTKSEGPARNADASLFSRLFYIVCQHNRYLSSFMFQIGYFAPIYLHT